MKIQRLPIIGLLALSLSCGHGTVRNGDLEIAVDRNMALQVHSLAASAPLCTDGTPTDALLADGLRIDDFVLTGTARHGRSRNWTGLCQQDDIRVEKHLDVTPLEDYPGMALVRLSYVNRGRTLSVEAVEWNALEVEADSLVWSFQPSSTPRRQDWILPVRPGFDQRNYLGMNAQDYGGGIPMVSLWRRDAGISTGLTERTLKTVSMPVEWRPDGSARMALRHDYGERISLSAGDTLAVYESFVAVHTGDFYEPLHRFARFMSRERGVEMPESSPEAFEPVWCAWGYERTFTLDEVVGTLAKVADVGFKWVDVDDGYQIAEGDWETNARFPGGDGDMRRLTDEIHRHGLKAKLWWAPLAADPGTRILREHPEMQLVTADGSPEKISWWDSYYLSPVNPATERYTAALVDRFIGTWNFDGLKLDGQHLNCCMPDHNPHSGLSHPEEAIEEFPTFFKLIYDRALAIKPEAVVQLCPCGCAMNFFNLPYMNQAVASDPKSSWQIRLKGKAYKAINEKLAYYADHVELSDGGCDFATQLGIGGVVGSKFTWPKNNPDVKEDYVLTPEKEVLYKKWVGLYNHKMLSTGSYLNLYDMGWDKPEAHVIAKDGRMYYAFYADNWQGEPITLRGLDAGCTYTVAEYADRGESYLVDGSHPVITPTFSGHYLIEVYRNKTTN